MSRVLVGGIPEFNDIDYAEKGLNISDIDIGNILKLFNLGNISNEMLEEKVSDEIQMDLKTPEAIDYINQLYQKALKTYIETFLINIKAPFTTQKFKDKGEVIQFLRLTSTSGNKERRQIYCDLVKIMFSYNEIEKHSQLKYAEKNTHEFIARNYLNFKAYPELGSFEFDLASIMEKKKGKDYYETKGFYFKKIDHGVKRIPCTFRYRGKSNEKMVIKMLGSEKGSSKIMDLIQDSIGVELEAENKEESIYLLEYEYFVHKINGNIGSTDFRQKPGFYSPTDIQKFCSQSDVSQEFRDYLKKLDTLKKKHGTMKYQDCKLQGMIELEGGKFNGAESRVVTKGNKNQSGISASEVVDGKKIIEAVIGMRGWVSRSYVQRVVDKVCSIPGVEKSEEFILENYLGGLVKVQVPKLNRNIYSSLSRLEEVVKNAHEYPEFIVNAIMKHFNYKGEMNNAIEGIKAGTMKAMSS